MSKLTYSALGIDPSDRVVGSSISKGKLLLRTRTTDKKTHRYVACYDSSNEFKYFRRVSSSERKRLGKGEDITCPLEQLDWVKSSNCWLAQWNDKQVRTLTPTQTHLAPTDYSTYVIGNEMVSKQKFKELIHEDHNN